MFLRSETAGSKEPVRAECIEAIDCDFATVERCVHDCVTGTATRPSSRIVVMKYPRF